MWSKKSIKTTSKYFHQSVHNEKLPDCPSEWFMPGGFLLSTYSPRSLYNKIQANLYIHLTTFFRFEFKGGALKTHQPTQLINQKTFITSKTKFNFPKGWVEKDLWLDMMLSQMTSFSGKSHWLIGLVFKWRG